MQGRPSIHSPLLVKSLVGHFINQEKHPERGGGSLVIGLASELSNFLRLFRKILITY